MKDAKLEAMRHKLLALAACRGAWQEANRMFHDADTTYPKDWFELRADIDREIRKLEQSLGDDARQTGYHFPRQG